jgi:hypothetical protein
MDIVENLRFIYTNTATQQYQRPPPTTTTNLSQNLEKRKKQCKEIECNAMDPKHKINPDCVSVLLWNSQLCHPMFPFKDSEKLMESVA